MDSMAHFWPEMAYARRISTEWLKLKLGKRYFQSNTVEIKIDTLFSDFGRSVSGKIEKEMVLNIELSFIYYTNSYLEDVIKFILQWKCYQCSMHTDTKTTYNKTE